MGIKEYSCFIKFGSNPKFYLQREYRVMARSEEEAKAFIKQYLNDKYNMTEKDYSYITTPLCRLPLLGNIIESTASEYIELENV